MSRSLTEHLDAARRALRAAAIIRGLALTVVALVAGVILAGTIDFLMRGNDPLWRMLVFAVAFVPAIVIFGALLVWPMIRPVGLTEIARRIDAADPSWAGELGSAAAFLAMRPETGSLALQRQTLESATAQLARPHRRLVLWGPVRRIGFVGIAAAVAAGLLLALAPATARVALARLALPFRAVEWPRRVDLDMLDEAGQPLPGSLQIGQGRSYRFYVTNSRGKLPEDLVLEVRRQNGVVREEPIPTAEAAPADVGPGRVGVATLFAENGPLKFRVVGGDDRNMPYARAEVVVPPRLSDFKVTVTPPAYLRSEPQSRPAGSTRVRGLLGSTVTIEARANKPLASAELFVGDLPGPAPTILAGGQKILASFRLANERPSSYWFRLRDRKGFANSQAPRYEIAAQIDAPPEVSLDAPAADIRATPDALIPISVAARDDHGIAEARLRYGPGTRLPDSQSTSLEKASRTIPLLGESNRPAEFERRIEWPLESLALSVGDMVTLRAEAVDAFDLGPPQIGMSPPRTIAIVSPDAKRRELIDRQIALLRELAEAHLATGRLQRAIGSLAAELGASNELLPTHRDQLGRAELELRRLGEELVGPDGSSDAAAARLLAEARANHLKDAALRSRPRRIADALAAIRENSLEAANRRMTAARKAPDAAGAADALGSAIDDVAIMEQILASLVDELGVWRNRRNVLAELRELGETQRELIEATAEAAAATLGSRTDQLTPDQAGQLESLALRQINLSERIERLEKQLHGGGEQTGDKQIRQDQNRDDVPPESHKEQNPNAEDPLLADVAGQLASSGLAAKARSAGAVIRKNQLGAAGQVQSEIQSILSKMQKSLAASEPEPSAAKDFAQLKDRVSDLAGRQSSLLESLVKQSADRETPESKALEALRGAQENLRKETASAAAQARAAGAGPASDALAGASAKMAGGLEKLRKQEHQHAVESLAEALQVLRDTEERLAETIKKQQGALAKAIDESNVETIRALAERQAGVNKELGRLDSLKADQGTLTRSQLLSLRQTQRVQSTIADDTAALAESLGDAELVHFTLVRAAEQMQQVAERLEQRETGPETARISGAVLVRLREIVAAFETASKNAPRPESQPGDAPMTGKSPAGGVVPTLVQLELLRLRQVALQRRTQELNRQQDSAEPQARKQAIEAIGRELAELSRLANTLLPDSLPARDAGLATPKKQPRNAPKERQTP